MSFDRLPDLVQRTCQLFPSFARPTLRPPPERGQRSLLRSQSLVQRHKPLYHILKTRPLVIARISPRKPFDRSLEATG